MGVFDLEPGEWFEHRTYHHSRYSDVGALVAAKEERGLSISVCIPTRNESATVGPIVRSIRERLMDGSPLVEEVVVIDSESTDGTERVATEAGASVIQDREILPEIEYAGGKGDALWKSLFVLKGDLIAFVDADVTDFDTRFVTGLLGPLLGEEGVQYVKAFYERPIRNGNGLSPSGGGRVTELVARPLLNMFFPLLSRVIQPLSGEYAGTRGLLESLPFFTGYGVEFGLLVDAVNRHGLSALAQVDMERRIHRNQDVSELSRMAFAVLQVAFRRLDSLGLVELPTEPGRELVRFSNGDGVTRPEPVTIHIVERPPAIDVPGYGSAGR